MTEVKAPARTRRPIATFNSLPRAMFAVFALLAMSALVAGYFGWWI